MFIRVIAVDRAKSPTYYTERLLFSFTFIIPFFETNIISFLT